MLGHLARAASVPCVLALSFPSLCMLAQNIGTFKKKSQLIKEA